MSPRRVFRWERRVGFISIVDFKIVRRAIVGRVEHLLQVQLGVQILRPKRDGNDGKPSISVVTITGSATSIAETSDPCGGTRPSAVQTGTAGNLTTDGHLASLAIAHGASLVSCDADFARFDKLRWENPIAND